VKRIVILRHAKAEKQAPRGSDFDRPLAGRGEADAPAVGRLLARERVHPDAIVSSPARRALDTAKIVARELDFPWAEIRLEKAAYLADSDALLEIVRGCDDRIQTLLLVGHNPGISDLANALARRFAESLPTSAAVTIDCAADTWGGVRPGCGTLRRFDLPPPRS
jgi:phosphohistidine phosphatase